MNKSTNNTVINGLPPLAPLSVAPSLPNQKSTGGKISYIPPPEGRQEATHFDRTQKLSPSLPKLMFP